MCKKEEGLDVDMVLKWRGKGEGGGTTLEPKTVGKRWDSEGGEG